MHIKHIYYMSARLISLPRGNLYWPCVRVKDPYLKMLLMWQ